MIKIRINKVHLHPTSSVPKQAYLDVGRRPKNNLVKTSFSG